ncbi:DUF4345 family protein [Cryptosporangium aurantiacum]|uniref:DUF4345 domain-containing protein n=1 Tax=Cryptosporangium aurantiacum TaxID=134849 RepID=A0A1M7RGZ9_9ACTN|nr:DUF4345 family protein [Cryptosporangium aurantiacum]SHN45318.1 protein of unknown function [Cryptosporangium aurantiacum]
MTSVLIVVVAVFFAGMGIVGLAAPVALVKPFGITLSGAAARTEIRAVYGGFGVAIAVVLAVAVTDLGGIRTGAVTTVAAALLGMAGGRLVARVVETPRCFYPTWFYFWVEVAGAAGLLLAAWA